MNERCKIPQVVRRIESFKETLLQRDDQVGMLMTVLFIFSITLLYQEHFLYGCLGACMSYSRQVLMLSSHLFFSSC